MRRGYLRLLVCFFLLFGLLTPVSVHATDTSFSAPYRILVICSYNYAFPSVPQHIAGLTDGLGDLDYEITYECMDAKTYYHPEDINEFYFYLAYKLRQVHKYDLLVVMDDTALQFATSHRDVLFPDIPIVFVGINSLADAEAADAMDNVTGIAEVLDYESNYSLLRNLFPKRDHYVVFCDATNTSQGECAAFLDFASNHPRLNYTIINASEHTKADLIDTLSQLQEDSILFLLDFSEDGDDNIYSSAEGACLIQEAAPNVPIIRPSLAFFAGGILGGYSYSYENAGREAGVMARSILTGTDADSIPMVTSAVTELILEQSAMDHFKIKRSAIPQNATILNEHRTLLWFYRHNPLLSKLLIVIMFLFLFIIALLIIANIRRNRLIHHDFLTKIPNRTYLNKKVRYAKEHMCPYGIIMVDLDNFKKINDTMGHSVGDELLAAFASRLRSLSGRSVTFGRIGGDEFMGFMPNPNYEKADTICQQIVQIMSAPFVLSNCTLEITASIGCALYPYDNEDSSQITKLADQALYMVKASGKNNYQLARYMPNR